VRNGKIGLNAFPGGLSVALLADDVVAKLDALVANEHRGAGDQLANFVLALAAERAVEKLLATRFVRHKVLSL